MTGKKEVWLTAPYRATSFFTLKPASSTSSGGKSLLVPTPFALKMALLDVSLRLYGSNRGALMFPAIRNLRISLRIPKQAVVNNTFIKIMRPHHSNKIISTDTGLETPMGNTIAFREYVSFHDEMQLAFQGIPTAELSPLLLNINYLGKRGGFVQLQSIPEEKSWSDEELRANGYTILTESTTVFAVDGLLQMLDDCDPRMTFEHANIYSGKGISLGKERILHHVVLPYRLMRSSKSYSYYERID